jgi:hypothetical protein
MYAYCRITLSDTYLLDPVLYNQTLSIQGWEALCYRRQTSEWRLGKHYHQVMAKPSGISRAASDERWEAVFGQEQSRYTVVVYVMRHVLGILIILGGGGGTARC